MSERPFKENTKNPIMGDTPSPIKNVVIEEAIDELEQELNDFFTVFALTPGLITSHPIFGELNFDENVQLLYKHAQHHLKQFGLVD